MKYILLIVVVFFNAVAQAEIKSSYHTNYFDFNAKDFKSLVEAVKVVGPIINDKNAWASIKWELITEYNFYSSDIGCSLTVDSMELIANIQLPKWRNIENQKRYLRKWWAEYYSFISKHEHSHLNSAMASAKIFRLKLLEMPVQQDCSIAKSTYFTLKRQFMKEVAQADRQIDNRVRRVFNSNDKLFIPLKKHAPIVFRSGAITF
jgi:predicted secreted Zn-dependent protease